MSYKIYQFVSLTKFARQFTVKLFLTMSHNFHANRKPHAGSRTHWVSLDAPPPKRCRCHLGSIR